MEAAKRAEEEISAADPYIANVSIQLRLGHPFPNPNNQSQPQDTI